MIWVDSNGTDGKPTFRRRANLSWLSKICIHFREIVAWSRNSLTTFMHLLTFLEKDPLRANFQKCFPKGFMCKFREIWLTWNRWNRALFTGQKKFHSLSRCRFYADRIQNLLGPAPNNILGVSQISSESVHFRRSYSRARGHRWNAPQSVSNTRRSVFADKNMLNSNISPTCSPNMVNFDPLAAEICWRVWGTPANFNGFRVLQGSVTTRHSSSGRQPNFAALSRRRHLYSAGRPSRWALTHNPVAICFQ